MWDLIVSVPDHCLSFYLLIFPRSYSMCHTSICIGGNFEWLV